MNVEKTKAFYKQLKNDDICSCAYCQNYVKEITASYQALAEYLNHLGVDIEKPLETSPGEPDETGYIEYVGPQYIVCGEPGGFEKSTIDGVHVDIAKSHPSIMMEEAYFVIEMYPIRLKWVV